MRAAMRVIALTVSLVVVLIPAVAVAGQNVLSWTDNASNELNTKIERVIVPDLPSCTAATPGFAELAQTGANVVTFTDLAVSEEVTYCYRVRAWNTAGDSAYSNVAARKVPATIPFAPSNLVVQ